MASLTVHGSLIGGLRDRIVCYPYLTPDVARKAPEESKNSIGSELVFCLEIPTAWERTFTGRRSPSYNCRTDFSNRLLRTRSHDDVKGVDRWLPTLCRSNALCCSTQRRNLWGWPIMLVRMLVQIHAVKIDGGGSSADHGQITGG